jgi:hypothetical protein
VAICKHITGQHLSSKSFCHSSLCPFHSYCLPNHNLRLNGKGKKFTLVQATKPQRGEGCSSSTLSLTSALDGVGSLRLAPDALPPTKARYPLYRDLGGHQGRFGQVRKVSLLLGFDPRTVQAVASRYTG